MAGAAALRQDDGLTGLLKTVLAMLPALSKKHAETAAAAAAAAVPADAAAVPAPPPAPAEAQVRPWSAALDAATAAGGPDESMWAKHGAEGTTPPAKRASGVGGIRIPREEYLRSQGLAHTAEAEDDEGDL